MHFAVNKSQQKCRFYDKAYYTMHLVGIKSQQKCRFHDAYYTLHHIVIKTSKNADFMTELIIQCIISLLKSPKLPISRRAYYTLNQIVIKTRKKMTISRWSTLNIASYCEVRLEKNADFMT